MRKNYIVNAAVCLIMIERSGQISKEEAERRMNEFRQTGQLSDGEYETACCAADLIELGIERTSVEAIPLAGGYQQ